MYKKILKRKILRQCLLIHITNIIMKIIIQNSIASKNMEKLIFFINLRNLIVLIIEV